MRVPVTVQMKLGRRLLSLASAAVGLSLLGWGLYLNHTYETTMPRQPDVWANRTFGVTANDGTRIFVTEAEARTLEHAQTFFTFGWPFLVLGVLMGVSIQRARDAVEPGADTNVIWTDRR